MFIRLTLRYRRKKTIFTIVVARAIVTISHTHQAIPGSGCAGVGAFAGGKAGAVGNTETGNGVVGSAGGGDGAALSPVEIYFTEPISWD